MTDSISKSTLLLVEGSDDVAFFVALASRLGLIDHIQVQPMEGKEIAKRLKTFFPKPEAEDLPVRSLGIVRDADDDPKRAFQSVQSALKQARLPAPSKPLETRVDRLNVTVFIMPDSNSTRMLEDLCLRALQAHPLMTCVQEYMTCVIQQQPLRPKNVPKATVQALLACIEDDKNEVRLRLSIAVNQPWWPWEDHAFNDVKAFVRQIAEAGAS